MRHHPIYLDHNATTPVAPEVAEAMCSALRDCYGNPSSSYALGQEASCRVDKARRQVAALIGANSHEIVFTGGATEANNLALLGVANAMPESKRHLIVSAVEHPAVMEPARFLESRGWRLTVLPADHYGRVSPDQVTEALRPDTALVSIMLANNEIGTLQPVAEIARRLQGSGVLLHTDAAQAVGKIGVDVNSLGIDLLALAGHKFQASKGVGALYIRNGTPITRILYGAGHEGGLRPGTENVPAIIGLGVAAELAMQRIDRADDHLADSHLADNHLKVQRDFMHELLAEAIPGIQLNGHPQARLPNTLNVSFPGVQGRDLLKAASDVVMASVGSACHTQCDSPSGVLGALGLDQERVSGAVRLSVGWNTTKEDVVEATNGLLRAWRHLTASKSA